MPSRPFRMAAAALALLALAAPFASAKQVRINVTNFDFTPRYASMNLGDHAVWIWNNTPHTVTQGDTADVPVTPTPGTAKFNSGDAGISNATYTWKANASGLIQYYCIPHWPSMVGGLDVVASGAQGLSDFRITEVQYNVAGNADLIEITNLGATGDLGKYRLKISGATVQTLAIGASTNIAVPAGGRVVLHVGQSGTNTATDLFFNLAAGLPDAAGSVALYVPNTQSTALTNATQIIDYVAWGAAAQENEATAASALLWTAGTSVGAVASGSSIEFCGQSGQYGAARWYENPTPNFGGSDNCLTPVTPTTWGRIKTLYR